MVKYKILKWDLKTWGLEPFKRIRPDVCCSHTVLSVLYYNAQPWADLLSYCTVRSTCS